ncbi:hypothetical protein AWW67_15710 [Roseivirga seohaensis]|uniref:Uncharacterized protein n=1 Tax=Roseivirga seohaensis TaxID=1914963 RepID=A0A150Y296_9BACT|nr:hypothetical protein AWW67_15710 [Roseivirga seohaensis]
MRKAQLSNEEQRKGKDDSKFHRNVFLTSSITIFQPVNSNHRNKIITALKLKLWLVVKIYRLVYFYM